MKYNSGQRAKIILFFTLFAAAQAFAGLSQKQINLLHEACYEVLIKKPAADSLTYEKELPWNLIPFNIRNDKYYSIGTAFAVSATELLSAHHVLQIGKASEIFKEIYVRDKEGNVYEADTILKSDNHRDFVTFTLKNKTFSKWLKTKNSYKMDETVFTVGHAYGEGIIIGEGTLNGTIPESEKGEFVYLKSSSDAKKGNKGGPLLDKKGNVIGIVVMKKDNTTYSLPYEQVAKAENNRANFHKKITFSFLVFPEDAVHDFDLTIQLPMDYKKLTASIHEAYDKFYREKMDVLFNENKEEMFPNGASSLDVLYGRYLSSLPQLIFKNKNNMKWTISNFESEDIRIADNGNVRFLQVTGGLSLFDIHKPDTMSLKDLYSKPAVLMDLILSSLNIPRKLANKEIRILSLGKPASVSQHSDSYGRKWQISKWLIEYSDEYIVTLSTPTPKGCMLLFTTTRTADLSSWMYDVQKITDFMYFSYRGDLSEWSNFLKQTAYIPDKFNQITLDYKKDSSLLLKTDKLKINLANHLEISDKTELTLNFDFYREGNKTAWDVRRILIAEKGKENYFSIYRHIKPDPGLNENFHDSWKELVTKSHPYNNMPYNEEGKTNIGSLHAKYAPKSEKELEKNDFIYSVFLAREGQVKEREMKKTFDAIKSGVIILE